MMLLLKIREVPIPVSVSGIGAIPGISDNRYHDIDTSQQSCLNSVEIFPGYLFPNYGMAKLSERRENVHP